MKLPRLTLSSCLSGDTESDITSSTVQQQAQTREEAQSASATQQSFAAPLVLSPSRQRPDRRPTHGLVLPRQTVGTHDAQAARLYDGALQLCAQIRDRIANQPTKLRAAKVADLIDRLAQAVGQLEENKASIGGQLSSEAWTRIKNFQWAVQHHHARMRRGLDVETSHQLLRQDLSGAMMRRGAQSILID